MTVLVSYNTDDHERVGWPALIERLAEARCNSLISRMFLFK